MPVEEFSHAQYSALPSVEWQQRGENMDAPLQHCTIEEKRGVVRSLWGRRSETCGNSPSYVGSVWTEYRESTEGL